jgi:hypothetical protein
VSSGMASCISIVALCIMRRMLQLLDELEAAGLGPNDIPHLQVRHCPCTGSGLHSTGIALTSPGDAEPCPGCL